MYQEFYRLKDEPFRLTPDPAYVYLTEQHREALSGLLYSIRTGRGLTVLIGEAGTGKTTLLRTLFDLLNRKEILVARCNIPTIGQSDLYDLLLTQFGIPCASPLKSQQIRALEDGLTAFQAAGRTPVLIVDEAQKLSPEVLEEIRLLLNLETDRQKLLQMIITGQSELESILSRPELRQFKQRVSAICRIGPLTTSELFEYVEHRLTVAGCPRQKIFPEDVLRLLYVHSQGIPRVINRLCDTALQTGFALQAHQITVSIMNEAAAELELRPGVSTNTLPVPSNGTQPKASVVPGLPPLLATPKQETTQPDPRATSAESPTKASKKSRGLSFFTQMVDRWK